MLNMTPEQKSEIVTRLLWLFESQKFDHWYNKKFSDHISGEVASGEIRKDIEAMIFPE